VAFIPISALKGDNIVNSSVSMPWYKGSTLMHHLETVHIAGDRNFSDFRFPVQMVNRPNLNFRGYCGTVASGVVRPGDEVMVLPSRKTNRVKSIVTFEGDLPEAFAGMAVTLTLEKEVDASRGDMLVHPDNLPHVGQAFEAMLVWMAEEPMTPGKQYYLKHATKVDHRRRAGTSPPREREYPGAREGRPPGAERDRPGRRGPDQPWPSTVPEEPGDGAFVIIDRLTNRTVGAGMILDRADGGPGPWAPPRCSSPRGRSGPREIWREQLTP
jgi:bifunctional enzyme CysN/CysC